MKNSANSKKYAGNMKVVILSLILSAAMCIFVNYITNPDVKTTLTGLHVHFTGESVLRERGLVITGRSSIPTSSVVVSGKRKDLIEGMDKVMIDVDVSDITEEGSYSLTGAIALPTTKITVEKEKYGEIPIKVERLREKEIPIKIRQTGTLKNMLVKSEAENAAVTLTGAQSELDKVSYGVADVDISKITADITLPVKYILLDKTGSYIEKNETLESYAAEIMVKNTVYSEKTLPVKLKLTEEMEKKYQLNEDKSSLSVTSAEVGVRPENTDEYVTVYIDKADNQTGEYKISEPEGMYIPESNKTVKVRLDLTPKVTKEIEIEPYTEGLSEKFHAEVNKIHVSAIGIEDKLNPDNIKGKINLDGLDEGVHTVPVEIEGDGITTELSYFTTVTISLKED